MSFTDPQEPIKIARLKGGLNVAELFHGPTLAFKVPELFALIHKLGIETSLQERI